MPLDTEIGRRRREAVGPPTLVPGSGTAAGHGLLLAELSGVDHRLLGTKNPLGWRMVTGAAGQDLLHSEDSTMIIMTETEGREEHPALADHLLTGQKGGFHPRLLTTQLIQLDMRGVTGGRGQGQGPPWSEDTTRLLDRTATPGHPRLRLLGTD